jgi:hypothetical protein
VFEQAIPARALYFSHNSRLPISPGHQGQGRFKGSYLGTSSCCSQDEPLIHFCSSKETQWKQPNFWLTVVPLG